MMRVYYFNFFLLLISGLVHGESDDPIIFEDDSCLSIKIIENVSGYDAPFVCHRFENAYLVTGLSELQAIAYKTGYPRFWSGGSAEDDLCQCQLYSKLHGFINATCKDLHRVACVQLNVCDWKEWSVWSECAGECGPNNGTTTRTRTCDGHCCLGIYEETEICTIPDSPLTEWKLESCDCISDGLFCEEIVGNYTRFCDVQCCVEGDLQMFDDCDYNETYTEWEDSGPCLCNLETNLGEQLQIRYCDPGCCVEPEQNQTVPCNFTDVEYSCWFEGPCECDIATNVSTQMNIRYCDSGCCDPELLNETVPCTFDEFKYGEWIPGECKCVNEAGERNDTRSCESGCCLDFDLIRNVDCTFTAFEYNEWDEGDCECDCALDVPFRVDTRTCKTGCCPDNYTRTEPCEFEGKYHDPIYGPCICDTTTNQTYQVLTSVCDTGCCDPDIREDIEYTSCLIPEEWTDWFPVTNCTCQDGQAIRNIRRYCLSGCCLDTATDTEDCDVIPGYTDWQLDETNCYCDTTREPDRTYQIMRRTYNTSSCEELTEEEIVYNDCDFPHVAYHQAVQTSPCYCDPTTNKTMYNQTQVCSSGCCVPYEIETTVEGPCGFQEEWSNWCPEETCVCVEGEGERKRTRTCLSGCCTDVAEDEIPCKYIPVYNDWEYGDCKCDTSGFMDRTFRPRNRTCQIENDCCFNVEEYFYIDCAFQDEEYEETSRACMCNDLWEEYYEVTKTCSSGCCDPYAKQERGGPCEFEEFAVYSEWCEISDCFCNKTTYQGAVNRSRECISGCCDFELYDSVPCPYEPDFTETEGTECKCEKNGDSLDATYVEVTISCSDDPCCDVKPTTERLYKPCDFTAEYDMGTLGNECFCEKSNNTEYKIRTFNCMSGCCDPPSYTEREYGDCGFKENWSDWIESGPCVCEGGEPKRRRTRTCMSGCCFSNDEDYADCVSSPTYITDEGDCMCDESGYLDRTYRWVTQTCNDMVTQIGCCTDQAPVKEYCECEYTECILSEWSGWRCQEDGTWVQERDCVSGCCPSDLEYTRSASCPPGWDFFPTSQPSCVKYYSDKKKFHDAMWHCMERKINGVSLGANLYEPKTMGDALLLADEFDPMYWIGIKRDPTDHYNWVYASQPHGSVPMDVFQWFNTNQPNDHGGNQDCVEIYQGPAGWNDQDCGKNNPFVCQFPIDDFDISIDCFVTEWNDFVMMDEATNMCERTSSQVHGCCVCEDFVQQMGAKELILRCPAGFEPFASTEPSCTKVETNTMNFHDAKANCETYPNGKLLEPMDDNDIMQLDNQYGHLISQKPWLGMKQDPASDPGCNRHGPLCLWMYATSGLPVTLDIPWGPNEPNGGTGEMCINYFHASNNGWNDDGCFRNFISICQVPPTVLTVPSEDCDSDSM